MTQLKTALVTGGAIRIGRAIALSFADAGWNVAVHYHNSESAAQELAAAIKAKGRLCHLVRANLQDEKAVSRIIPELTEKKVKLDCLINNASAFEKDSYATLSSESWHKHMGVNLFAPMQLIRDFAAQCKSDDGNIINITDGMHGWSMSGNFLSYAMSKQNLEYATQLLASELAPHIRINAIAPGATLEGVQDKKDTFDKLRKLIPLGRTSSPDEIIATLHYILSVRSITGQIISLSGGMQGSQSST